MAYNYLSFITDEHLIMCVENLHKSYGRAKNNIGRKTFYNNKIDTIKLTFDSKFNNIDQESLIEAELLRQVDKSINNSIGTFHEEILGGIDGFEIGKQNGYDIKAVDNTLFADIKNKHNTTNSASSESLFQKLARYADTNKQSKCYWVQILALGSFCTKWEGTINGKEYSHTRVYRISGDQFYALLSGKPNALKELYRILPRVIDDYLALREENGEVLEQSVFEEIKELAESSQRTILDQITFDNFRYYLGFENL